VVVRLYEAWGRSTKATLSTALPVASVAEADLLEREGEPLPWGPDGVPLAFRPFEIKTLLLRTP
jgi:alpha-mannosidase